MFTNVDIGVLGVKPSLMFTNVDIGVLGVKPFSHVYYC